MPEVRNEKGLPPTSPAGPTNPQPTPRLGPFGRLAFNILRHPRLFALGVLVSTLLGVLLAQQLHVDADMLRLLPDGDPSVAALQELDRQEGGVNLLTISVEGPDQVTVDAYLQELLARVHALPEVRHALYQVPPELAHRVAILQLNPTELALIRDRLRGAIALGAAASNPFLASKLYDLGPLTKKLAAPTDKLALVSAPNMGRLVIRPHGSSHDVPFARALMAGVRGAIRDTDPESRGIRVLWIGGPYRHTIEDVDGVAHDIGWTAIPSFLLVSLAILIAFRDWRPVVAIILPQLVGTAWTLGFARIAVGSMNMFTSFAVAVLVGLGNDYGIVLYGRYRELRAQGLPVEESITRAWDRSAGPAFTAALTAAAGFLALLTASFQGFQQLGIVIGAGVPFCFLSVILLMPLLIKWTRPKVTPTIDMGFGRRIEGRKPGYWLSIPVLLVGILVVSVGGWAMTRVPFDYDISALRREGLAFVELAPQERKLAQESYSPVIVSYDTEEALNQDYDRIHAEIASGAFPEVARVLSIRTLIPEDAPRRAELLQEIAKLARGANLSYLPAAVRKNLEQLTSLSPGEDYSLERSDLPDAVLNLLGASTGHHRMLMIPTGNMWDLRECAALSAAVHAHLPDRAIAGEYISMGELYRVIRADAPRIIVSAFLLVSALLLFDLRSPSRVFWAMLVQVAGMVSAAAVLVLLGLRLNLVNFVAIPIIVGTGIETVIFLVHRLQEEGSGGIARTLLTSGLASSLCVITTLLAFASLTLASSRGIRSLGQVIFAGDATVAITAFILLPAGAGFYWFLRGRLGRT